MRITILLSAIIFLAVIVFVWKIDRFWNRRLQDIDGIAGIVEHDNENVVLCFNSNDWDKDNMSRGLQKGMNWDSRKL